jgi:2-oxoglutarate ferredoxin oxidoreductase subunit beta
MNPDYALFVHNNKVFALTTGQITPTSEKGYKGKSTPKGSPLITLNPLTLALQAGATFVAREYATDMKNLTKTMKAAIKHKGFAYVDILQPCLTFHDFTDYIKDKMYRIKPSKTRKGAIKVADEWDYSLNPKAKIPVGIFYKEKRQTLGEGFDTRVWHKIKKTPNLKLWESLKVK